MQEVQWIGNKVRIINHTPQWKIDDAKKVLKDAIRGHLPFAIREFIPTKQYKVRKHLIKKWMQEHRHDPMHDETSLKKWRSNLNRIRNACRLLFKEGILSAWHVDGTGRLSLTWFTKYVEPDRPPVRYQRTSEPNLPRVDEFSRDKTPYELMVTWNVIPERDPYHSRQWRWQYEEAQELPGTNIVKRMSERHGQADVLAIIERAYVECDFDTLHQYNAPLSCPLKRVHAWAVADYEGD